MICVYKAHPSVVIYVDFKEKRNQSQKPSYRYCPFVRRSEQSFPPRNVKLALVVLTKIFEMAFVGRQGKKKENVVAR